MIKEYKDYNSDITESCDVCIIGSGAGGAVAAKEISGRGYSVILLEEGGYYKKDNWSGKPTQGLIDMYRDGGSTGTIGRPFISLTMGRCIGGTTTINSATCFRTPDKILLKWKDELGLETITPESMNPYFERVERAVNVTELSWDVLGKAAGIVKRGADALGLNCRPLKHNVKDCRGCGTCQFGCIGGAKQSMDMTYIPAAVKNGARIFSSCRAERLIVKDGRVMGVRARIIDPASYRKTFNVDIEAAAVVAACGSLITPAILRRSGLKNRNIGRHLQIHPAGRVVAVMDEPVEGWKGVSQGAFIDDFEGDGIMLEGVFVHPSIMLPGLPGIGMEHKEIAALYPNLAAFGVMVHDSSTGRVFRMPGGNYISSYFIKRRDAEKLKRGIALTSKIFFAAGAKKIYTSISKMPVLESPDDVDRLEKLRVRPSQIEMMAFHPLGTCRMAGDSKRGVVDSHGESFEVKNLFVSDGSIVPSSLGVNPQITIMALSTMVAERVVRRLENGKKI